MPPTAPTCSFCHEPEGDVNGLGELLGPIHGAPSGGGEPAFVHRVCALWSPQVCETAAGDLRGVRAELRRGRALRCACCGERGASLGCRVRACQSTFHVACAQEAGATFYLASFQLACKAHAPLFASEAGVPKLLGLMLSVDTQQPMLSPVAVRKLAVSPDPGVKRRRELLQRRPAARAAEVEVARAALRRWQREERRAREASSSDEEHLQNKEAAREERDIAALNPVVLGGPGGSGPVDPDAPDFSRVAGLAGVKRALREMVLLPLAAPQALQDMGIIPPRGILLHGPPGTGKTLVVRALARECAAAAATPVTLFTRSGADCLGKFHGEAERTLRLLFQEAARRAPSVIFFDEMDALAPARTARHTGSDQTYASVVSTLLCLMDGLEDRGAVIIIAATNCPDHLDPALRRPGRFDREVCFSLPSAAERHVILSTHTCRWLETPDPALLSTLAQQTPGWAGADLQALVSSAVMHAARRILPRDGLGEAPPDPALLRGLRVQDQDWLAALAASPLPCARRAGGHVTPAWPPTQTLPMIMPAALATLRALRCAGSLPRRLHGLVDDEEAALLAVVLASDEQATGRGEGSPVPTHDQGGGECSAPSARVLLQGTTCEGSGGAGDVAACILNLVSGDNVHVVSAASLISAGGADLALGVTRVMQGAKRGRAGTQPPALYLPHLEVWAVDHEEEEGTHPPGPSHAWMALEAAVTSSGGIGLAAPYVLGTTGRTLPDRVLAFFTAGAIACEPEDSSAPSDADMQRPECHVAGHEERAVSGAETSPVARCLRDGGGSVAPTPPPPSPPEAALAQAMDAPAPLDTSVTIASPGTEAAARPPKEGGPGGDSPNDADLAAGLALYCAELSFLRDLGQWLARDPRVALTLAPEPPKARGRRRRDAPPTFADVATRARQGRCASLDSFLHDLRAARAAIEAAARKAPVPGHAPCLAAACALADESEQRCHTTRVGLGLGDARKAAQRKAAVAHVAALAKAGEASLEEG